MKTLPSIWGIFPFVTCPSICPFAIKRLPTNLKPSLNQTKKTHPIIQSTVWSIPHPTQLFEKKQKGVVCLFLFCIVLLCFLFFSCPLVFYRSLPPRLQAADRVPGRRGHSHGADGAQLPAPRHHRRHGALRCCAAVVKRGGLGNGWWSSFWKRISIWGRTLV